MTASGWEGLLEDGEDVLWQGKPKPGLELSEMIDMQTVMGIVFTAFATFWVTQAASMVSEMRSAPEAFKLFPLFGLIFVAVGLNMLVGRHIKTAYQRRNTFYTLTNQAAFIATKSLGSRKLTRFGLDEMSEISLTDSAKGWGSVHFDKEVTHYQSNRSNRRSSTRVAHRPIGFLRIDDARKVHRMLIEAQRDVEKA